MLKANIIVDLDPNWAGRGFDTSGEDITIPPSVFIPDNCYPPFYVIQNGNRVVQIFKTIDQLEQRLLEMKRIMEMNKSFGILEMERLPTDVTELIAL